MSVMKNGGTYSMRTINARRDFISGFSKMLFCCMIFIIGHSIGNAQATTIYGGVTPASVATGSPLGSYSISNFEDINLLALWFSP
jgi:hypothetical protein